VHEYRDEDRAYCTARGQRLVFHNSRPSTGARAIATCGGRAPARATTSDACAGGSRRRSNRAIAFPGSHTAPLELDDLRPSARKSSDAHRTAFHALRAVPQPKAACGSTAFSWYTEPVTLCRPHRTSVLTSSIRFPIQEPPPALRLIYPIRPHPAYNTQKSAHAAVGILHFVLPPCSFWVSLHASSGRSVQGDYALYRFVSPFA